MFRRGLRRFRWVWWGWGEKNQGWWRGVVARAGREFRATIFLLRVFIATVHVFRFYHDVFVCTFCFAITFPSVGDLMAG